MQVDRNDRAHYRLGCFSAEYCYCRKVWLSTFRGRALSLRPDELLLFFCWYRLCQSCCEATAALYSPISLSFLPRPG